MKRSTVAKWMRLRVTLGLWAEAAGWITLLAIVVAAVVWASLQ